MEASEIKRLEVSIIRLQTNLQDSSRNLERITAKMNLMKVPTGQRASQRKTNGPFDEHFDISVPSKRRRDSNGTNEIKSEPLKRPKLEDSNMEQRGRRLFGSIISRLNKAKEDEDKLKDQNEKRARLEEEASKKQGIDVVIPPKRDILVNLESNIQFEQQKKQFLEDKLKLYLQQVKELKGLEKSKRREFLKWTKASPPILYATKQYIEQRMREKEEEKEQEKQRRKQENALKEDKEDINEKDEEQEKDLINRKEQDADSADEQEQGEMNVIINESNRRLIKGLSFDLLPDITEDDIPHQKIESNINKEDKEKNNEEVETIKSNLDVEQSISQLEQRDIDISDKELDNKDGLEKDENEEQISEIQNDTKKEYETKENNESDHESDSNIDQMEKDSQITEQKGNDNNSHNSISDNESNQSEQEEEQKKEIIESDQSGSESTNSNIRKGKKKKKKKKKKIVKRNKRGGKQSNDEDEEDDEEDDDDE